MKEHVEAREVDILNKLHQHFEGAITYLQKTPISEGARQKRFDLPCFIVLGLPRSGQSTLISHAQLDFLMSAHHDEKKHRLTHGEWFATEDALFFEVNHDYVLQHRKSHLHRKRWLACLKQFETSRGSSPFNGVLFCIDIEQLCATHKHERHVYFHSLRGRIKELSAHTKRAYPLYLIFTKLDKLQGFNDFFYDLNQSEITQLLGITFNLEQGESQASLADAFDIEYDKLLDQLNQRLIQRLHYERHLDRRHLIKAFPLQLETLKKPLAALLAALSENFAANQAAKLRGLYFCAAKPSAEPPIDRLQSSFSHTFELYPTVLPASPQFAHRSYFTSGIFKQVIADSHLRFESLSRTPQRFYRPLQWAGIFVLLLMMLGMIGYWMQVFSKDMTALNEIEQVLASANANISPGQTFDLNRAVVSIGYFSKISKLSQTVPLPWVIRTLFPHDAFVYHQASQAFNKTVMRTAEGILSTGLQSALAESSGTIQSAGLYADLAGYLMLADPIHFKQSNLIAILDQAIGARLSLDNQGVLNQAFTLALIPDATYPLDNELIKKARDVFNHLSPADKANALIAYRFINQHPLLLTLPQFNGKPIFNSTQAVFEIPIWFTRPFFDRVYDKTIPDIAKPLINGDWVSVSHPSDADISPDAVQKIRSFYIQSYIATWSAVLENLELMPFTSYDQALFVITALSDPQSAWIQLIYDIVNNTHVVYQGSPTPILQVFHDFDAASNQILADNHDNLNALASYLRMIATNQQPAMAAFELLKAHRLLPDGQADAFTALNNELLSLPTPYRQWFESILENSLSLILKDSATALSSVWQSSVYSEFIAHIADNYPFNPLSAKDLSLSDLIHFFGPNGTLNNFMHFYISPFIDYSQEEWTFKSFYGAHLPLSLTAMTTLKEANHLSTLFFPQSNGRMGFSFLLKPIDLSSNIKTYSVNINGKMADFSNDFLIASRFEWPGQAHLQLTNIDITNVGNQTTNINFVGLWSLFHFLSTLSPTFEDNHLLLTFNQDNESAHFEYIPDQGNAKKMMMLLEGYRLGTF